MSLAGIYYAYILYIYRYHGGPSPLACASPPPLALQDMAATFAKGVRLTCCGTASALLVTILMISNSSSKQRCSSLMQGAANRDVAD